MPDLRSLLEAAEPPAPELDVDALTRRVHQRRRRRLGTISGGVVAALVAVAVIAVGTNHNEGRKVTTVSEPPTTPSGSQLDVVAGIEGARSVAAGAGAVWVSGETDQGR